MPVAVLQLRNRSCELNAAESDVTLVAAAFSTYFIFCIFSARDSGHPRDDAILAKTSSPDVPNIFRAA